MTTDQGYKDTGLRGMKIADSNICLIKGDEGKLYYRGYSINDLAKKTTFEEVAYLLIHGDLPSSSQLREYSSLLVSNREIPLEIIEHLQRVPKETPSMNVLQATISMLAGFDPELSSESEDAKRRQITRIIAKIPTIVTTWERIRNNKSLIGSRRNLSHAANFLYMLNGKEPKDDIARMVDVDFILHAEHSFNASTFTARVIASTGADFYVTFSGAVSSLSGKLHGGAVSRVMENLLEINDISNVETWVKGQFDEGKLIMGMGHAVYKTLDPRAKILIGMAEQVLQKNPEIDSRFFEITKKMVEVTQKEFNKRKNRNIYPNVDCFSPSVYHALGIALEAFAPIFTISRVAGWAAHALEQQFPKIPGVKPVIYRPSADYAGKYCGPAGCPFVPLEQRGTQSKDAGLAKQLASQGDLDEDVIQQIIDLVVQEVSGKSTTQSSIQEKDLITEIDVLELNKKGLKELHLPANTVITPLARDKASKLGMNIEFK